jgi:phospholipid-binding lipoprotein MlaA
MSSGLNQEGPPAPEGRALAERDGNEQDGPVEEGGYIEDEEYLDEEEEVLRIRDPLIWINKGFYHFNDKFYFWVLKPGTRGYMYIVPEDVRIVVNNFFDNLRAPIRVINNLLQFKVINAGLELLRFGLNSTAGIAGLLDVAEGQGLKSHEEDFGQTLGKYGLGHGFYCVLPFIGPISARDSMGLLGDLLLFPVSYMRPVELAVGVRAYEEVNDTSFRIGDYETLKEAAIDPYFALRDAYLQNRRKAVEE